MSRIRTLSDHLISQIAAGEVVERPASVVKELVENALDAGATDIRLEMRGGGRDYLRVRDDGTGMDAEDARLAFHRHATSKLTHLEDLQSIATLGFRGEALAAIAAVSRVDLRTADADGAGFHVAVEAGAQTVAEPVPHPRGTTVEVSSLFFNVPARRKFLKQQATEQRRCLEVMTAYALHHRGLGFAAENPRGRLLEAPAVRDPDAFASLRLRVAQLFDSELAEHLVPFGDPPEGGDSIWGMVGDKETTRGRKSFVFVNGRLLRDRSLLALFYRAVRDEWGSGDFPSLFLFLQMPPDSVDVNVHPQKHEVRFRDPDVNARIYRALRRGLGSARGHEPAPVSSVTGLPTAPAAWQGLGREAGSSRETWRLERRDSADLGASVVAERISESTTPGALSGRPVPLAGRDGVERPFRVLGQYKAALILVEGPDGLYLIDQHVAHERVLFERILKSLEGGRSATQDLVSPLMLELSTEESERLADAREPLQAAGFEIEVLSGGTAAVSATPAMLSTVQAADFLTGVARSDVPAQELRGRFAEILAAGLSCRRAVKMHDVLGQRQLEELLSELFAADNPYACPHGRPVMLRLSDLELEKRFHRR